MTENLLDDQAVLDNRIFWQQEGARIARRTPAWYQGRFAAALVQAQLVDGHDHAIWQNNANGGTIPYQTLAPAGLEFAIIKATEGTAGVDPYWTQNWQGAHAKGLRLSCYHFFRSHLSGVTQATHYLNTTAAFRAAVGYSPILVLDVETVDGVTAATRTSRVIDCINTLINAGVQVGIYSSAGFWNGNIVHATIAPYLGLVWQWVAHWTSAGAPLKPTGWTDARLKFWQQGISGVHAWCPPPPAGFLGNVDYDRFFGTLVDLDNLLGIAEPTLEEKVDILWEAHPELHG
jgi:GH25 family lysozyme M1 (1,4-beta-N-acetylmuramidase)